MQLTFFTDRGSIRDLVLRNILEAFLEHFRDSLPADAAALLGAGLNYEQFCAAWAEQLSRPLPEPMLQALHAIEHLALPENRALLQQTIAQAPPNFIDRNYPPLNQALHLWLVAARRPHIHFPLPPSPPEPPAPATPAIIENDGAMGEQCGGANSQPNPHFGEPEQIPPHRNPSPGGPEERGSLLSMNTVGLRRPKR